MTVRDTRAASALLARALLTLVCLGFSLALLGCSSSDSPQETSEPPPADPPPSDPPPSDLPPLAAVAVSLDDGQTVGTARWSDGNASDGGVGQPVDGLECVGSSPIAYHVHTHLSIMLNDEALTVPNRVGFVELSAAEECQYPLHTHNATGLIHVHAEVETVFTLGQFFQIWGQPLEDDNVAGLIALPATAYLVDDGVVSAHSGELADIALTTRRQIVIQVGDPISEIPRFTWSAD